MNRATYIEADATTLADWVARGEVHPRELVEVALEQIEAQNGSLNAVVHLDADRALAAAEDLPEGPLRGVPFLLKDLGAEDAGQPSTYSCAAMADWRAPADAELVARYKRAGLNILGRTNTPELGIYGVTESVFRGPCRNPWDTSRTPGGSSGGAGAAVAARMVPVAHGGDGGGSIRIPASHCGVFGFKPTQGRVPVGPAVGESWCGLVVEHALSRTVRDSALLLDLTAGPEPGVPVPVAPPERPYREEVGRDPGVLRVAWTAEPLFGGQTHPENRTAVEEAAQLLASLGHEVEERHPPVERDALVRAYLVAVAAGVATDLHHLGRRLGRALRPRDVEPSTWLLGRIAHRTSAAALCLHRHTIHCARVALAGFFERYDVLLTPTCAVPPVPIGTFTPTAAERFQMAVLRMLDRGVLYDRALEQLAEEALAATPNTMLFNLTGHPAMSMPLHLTSDGLPVGVQAVGGFGEEGMLFRLAGQLEERFLAALPPGVGGDAPAR